MYFIFFLINELCRTCRSKKVRISDLLKFMIITIKIVYWLVLGRIFETLLANSHINMQTIRWPFMLKYAVPTVLGTPAQITIQSTVLASLRGNMTEELSDHQRTTSRSHQIDAR